MQTPGEIHDHLQGGGSVAATSGGTNADDPSTNSALASNKPVLKILIQTSRDKEGVVSRKL
jgi:hypothetical protein